MREVSCKATRMILEALEDAGLAVDPIERGLPVTLAELKDPRERVDWDVFAEFLERVEQLGRGVMTPEDVGERIVRVPTFDLVRRLGRLAMSPKQLFALANRLVAPALFANVIVTSEWLASGRLVISSEIPPGYRASTIFFRLCHANVVASPRVLDLPPAKIEEQTISGRCGRLVLVPPPSHTLAVRIRRRTRGLVAFSKAWRIVADQQHELEASLTALRASRREQQQLLERLPDGVLIHQNGIIRWANAALLDIFGASRVEDVIGRHVLDFAPSEDRAALEAAVKAAAPHQVSPTTHEYRVQRRDGTIRRVQGGATHVVDFRGGPARLVVLRDVTEHHRLREQAAIADRLASIGALAAGVAHEINNPLAYARLSLEMAARHASEGERGASELAAALDLARAGTDQALGIVRDLKTLSRLSDEHKEAVDLPALLDSTIGLARTTLAAKARVVRAYGPVPLAFGARSRLAQVFVNLLSNAADAIPAGEPSRHSITIATRTDAIGRAVVELTDTGCGIPPEISHRVFDAFFTTKPVGVGTGLGLAMCHRIVSELGGEITFDSVAGATTFRVTLPASPAAL